MRNNMYMSPLTIYRVAVRLLGSEHCVSLGDMNVITTSSCQRRGRWMGADREEGALSREDGLSC